jgi:hypothetical protein
MCIKLSIFYRKTVPSEQEAAAFFLPFGAYHVHGVCGRAYLSVESIDIEMKKNRQLGYRP